MMKRKTIISGTTLLFSLGAYYFAKKKRMDSMPVMLVAGFIGAIVGEGLSEELIDSAGGNQADYALYEIEE